MPLLPSRRLRFKEWTDQPTVTDLVNSSAERQIQNQQAKGPGSQPAHLDCWCPPLASKPRCWWVPWKYFMYNLELPHLRVSHSCCQLLWSSFYGESSDKCKEVLNTPFYSNCWHRLKSSPCAFTYNRGLYKRFQKSYLIWALFWSVTKQYLTDFFFPLKTILGKKAYLAFLFLKMVMNFINIIYHYLLVKFSQRLT